MSRPALRAFIAIYTDEDVTTGLAPALRRRGYSAQSTREAGNLGASDEAQLSYATRRNMAVLTHNIRDFIELAQVWHLSGREHAGIIVSEQFGHRHFRELVRQVLRLLDSLTPTEIHNQVIYLQRFKQAPRP